LLEVSRSGYYAWCKRRPSARAPVNAQLLLRIRQVHQDSLKRYGSPRVPAALRAAGVACFRGRVERLRRRAGRRAKQRGGFVLTTRPGGAYHPAGNVLNRRCAPGQAGALCADITYLPTAEGHLDLALVLCLATRRVLGWSMSPQLHGGLGLAALRLALQRCPQAPGQWGGPPCPPSAASDRGGQYVSHAFAALLARHQLLASLSRAGDCDDNAVAESCCATLQRELGLGQRTLESYAKLVTVPSLPVH
jgi:transposase InsO family protein